MIPEEEERVSGFFGRRGAYGRYKDWIEYKELFQPGYDFEAAETEKALWEWCVVVVRR